jgi:hypothetical protein
MELIIHGMQTGNIRTCTTDTALREMKKFNLKQTNDTWTQMLNNVDEE